MSVESVIQAFRDSWLSEASLDSNWLAQLQGQFVEPRDWELLADLEATFADDKCDLSEQEELSRKYPSQFSSGVWSDLCEGWDFAWSRWAFNSYNSHQGEISSEEYEETDARNGIAEFLDIDPSELQGDKTAYLREREEERGSTKGSKGSKVYISKSQLDRQIAESTGLLADMNQMTDSSIFGTGGLDSSTSNALGGLIGSQYGNQYGSGGLGSRGSGFGGGGTAAGLGGLGTRGTGLGGSGYGRGAGFYGQSGGAPGVGAEGPIILGALDKSLIDRVVKEHLAQIRYCYQKELAKNPKLFGKIVVKFVITTDGTVSSATTKSSTMNNPSCEQCINDQFLKMKFPKPKGDGVVIVSYPFSFNP